jgi:hypothetical protein
VRPGAEHSPGAGAPPNHVQVHIRRRGRSVRANSSRRRRRRRPGRRCRRGGGRRGRRSRGRRPTCAGCDEREAEHEYRRERQSLTDPLPGRHAPPHRVCGVRQATVGPPARLIRQPSEVGRVARPADVGCTARPSRQPSGSTRSCSGRAGRRRWTPASWKTRILVYGYPAPI